MWKGLGKNQLGTQTEREEHCSLPPKGGPSQMLMSTQGHRKFRKISRTQQTFADYLPWSNALLGARIHQWTKQRPYLSTLVSTLVGRETFKRNPSTPCA